MATNFETLCEQLLEDEGIGIDTNLFTALMVSLIGGQDVIISTKEITYIEKNIKLVASNIFGVQNPGVIRCSSETTWDIVTKSAFLNQGLPNRFVILSRLEQTSFEFQAQLLDALVRRQIVINNKTYKLSEWFLAVGIVQSNERKQVKLSPHLKERFFLMHNHESGGSVSTDQLPALKPHTIINEQYLMAMRQRLKTLTIIADIKRYMQNIVVFLRTHRLIRRGVPTKSVKDFELLVKALCILHDYEFATPSIVAIAARKVFPLKIELCEPEDEPSLNYGSDINIISNWLKKWDQDLIIEDVLKNVEPPL